MINELDETGKRYGRLVVLEYAGSNKSGNATWLCRCDCGKTTIISSHNLKSGNSKSCGCLWKDVVCLPEGEAAFNQLYNRIKQDIRGYEFDLTKEQVRQLVLQPCHYCGSPPLQKQKIGQYGYNGGLLYNGIDRINSSLGYVHGNVVSCCKHCNWAKNSNGRRKAAFRTCDLVRFGKPGKKWKQSEG